MTLRDKATLALIGPDGLAAMGRIASPGPEPDADTLCRPLRDTYPMAPEHRAVTCP